MAMDRMTVAFELPADRTAEEVVEALKAIGAERIRVYPPQPSMGRPMHGGFPE